MTNEIFFQYIWPTIWQSAILAAVVGGITLLLRDRLEPRWRYLLWVVVLARLALPVLPSSPVGILPTQFQPQSTTVVPSAIIPETPFFAEHATSERKFDIAPIPVTASATPSPIHETTLVTALTPIAALPTVKPAVSVVMGQRIIQALLAAWLIGALYFAFRYVSGEIRLRYLCRRVQTTRDMMLNAMLHECRSALRIRRRVRLYIVPQGINAASCGVFFPKILISERVIRQFSPDALRFVLLHELSHIKRFDPAVHLLTRLLTITYWPNPVLWLTRWCMEREREHACDAAVLRQLEQTQHQSYGEMVLTFAEWHTTNRSRNNIERNAIQKPTSALVGVFPNHDLKRRITMIAKHKRPRLSHTLLGVMLLATLALAGLTTAKPVTIPAMEPVAKPAAEKTEEPVAANATYKEFLDIPAGQVLIYVTIIDPDDKPVSNAKVHFQFNMLEDFGGKPGTTDAEGKFAFMTLERDLTGMQVIAVSPDDTLMAWEGIYDAIPDENRIIEKTIKLHDQIRTITGSVTNADGKPIEGAYVGGSSESHLPMFTKTDASGQFRFPMCGVGTDGPLFQVYAIKPGVGVAWVTTEEKPSWEGKTPPDKFSNGPFHLTIQDKQMMQVLVTDEHGHPLPNCTLIPSVQIGEDIPRMWYYSFHPNRQFSPPVCFATTDQNGLAIFDWVPKKDLLRFTVEAKAPNTPITLPDGSRHYFGESEYHYWNKTDEPMVIQLPIQAKVKGKIVNPDGTPATGYTFFVDWVTRTRPTSGQAILTDHYGKFEITGNVHDTFQTGSINFRPAQGLVFPNVYDFDIGDGNEVKELNLQLQKGTQVFGEVFGPDGKKIDWTEKYNLTGKNISPQSGILDRETSSTFGVSPLPYEAHDDPQQGYQIFLPPGTYEFTIRLKDRYKQTTPPEEQLGDTQTVTITENQNEVRVDFHLKPQT